jgi:hypothetical protein
MRVTEGIGSGDWLAAAGNLVGVILAVGGAVYVESWKRQSAVRSDLKMIEDALRELDSSFEELKKEPRINWEVSVKKRPVIEAMERLQSARELLGFTRKEAKVKDIHLWRQLGQIEAGIDEHDAMLTRELAILQGYSVTDRVLEINRSQLLAFVAAIQPLVRRTIEGLTTAGRSWWHVKMRQHLG